MHWIAPFGKDAANDTLGSDLQTATELAIDGQEEVAGTVHLCRMNLAVHGLEGDIRKAITYYEDLHQSTGRFDLVPGLGELGK